MRKGIAIAGIVVAMLAIPVAAGATPAELEQPFTQIRSGEVPVRGPWIKVTFACELAEGEVCAGSAALLSDPDDGHVGVRAMKLAHTRLITLLGGEVRPIAFRLAPKVVERLAQGGPENARIDFETHPAVSGGRSEKVLRLVPDFSSP